MRVLFINLPYFGHFVPTVGLVQELIQRDCKVTYLMPHDWKEKVEVSGAEFRGYQNHKKLSEQIKNAYRAGEEILQEYDILVYEQFFFLGKHLAEKYGKPSVRIFTAPVTNDKLMKEYMQAGGPLGIFKHKWIAKSWTKEITKNISGGLSLKTDNWLDEIIQNPPALNLIYTLRMFQPYEEEFRQEQYRFLGASVYERKAEGWAFEKKERPLIYVSLGTVVKGKKRFFLSCLDAFREEDVDVILVTGSRFCYCRTENIPKNMHIYEFVPQTEVLKQADVFVTHGGMNSISEAFIYGVPMVVIPFMSDQPVNAKRVEELGLGKKLCYSKLDKEVLKQTVFAVLNDSDMKQKLLLMQKRILEAPGNVGGAEMIIEYGEHSGRVPGR